MAAMAPALTDTAAHSATFKLPASPANPGFEGLFSASSPDLPEQLLSGTKVSPDPVTNQSTLVNGVASYDKIISADLPGIEFGSNGKHGLNGHSNSYYHLENLTQLMKGKDTSSVIELIKGLNGNRKTLEDPARTRPTMNGTELSSSDKVNCTEISTNVSFSAQIDSLHDRENLEHDPSRSVNNEDSVSDIFMIDDSKDVSISEQSGIDIHPDMVLDSGSSLSLDAELLSERSSFEKDLFPDDKVLSVADNLLTEISESSDPPQASFFDENESELASATGESLADVTSRLQTLEDRNRHILERLRQLQLSQLSVFAKEEIEWFVTQLQKDNIAESSAGCTECRQKRLHDSGHTVFLPCNKHAQGNCRTTKATSHASVAQRIIQRGNGKEVFRSIDDIQQRLGTNLEHVQTSLDSDATDSSSDESDEEAEFKISPNEGPSRGYHRLSLNKRAIWKWAVHRAGIARRWTWLQAQVSDLEYRIRQHSDIYRQIKAAKGTVTLGTHPITEEILRLQSLSRSGKRLSPIDSKVARLEKTKTLSPAPLSSVLSNVDHQSARLHQSLSNCLSPPPSHLGGEKTPPLQLNGCVHGRPSGNTTVTFTHNHRPSSGNLLGLNDSLALSPEEQHCARTRPVKFYRKRRLVRPRDLYTYNPKAKRLSSVRCGCCPPSLCVMCGGRFNNLKPLNPDAMPTQTKVAHLDSGYHPVLSFPYDIPLPVHFESLLSKGENERRVKTPKKRVKPVPSQLKGKKRNIKRLHKLRHKGKFGVLSSSLDSQSFPKKENRLQLKTERKIKGADCRYFPRSKSDSCSLPSTPKSEATTSEEELRICRTEVKKKRTQAYIERKGRERSLSLPTIGVRPPPSVASTPPDSKPSTPTPPLGSSLPASTLQSMNKKKAVQGDAYDIDNIVIPYSMLASTRVEKLHYKEIDTPGWRVTVNGVMSDVSHHLEEPNALRHQLEDEEEEEESTADSDYTHRHLTYEILEKKKFLAILANQGTAASGAGRRSRRTRNNSSNSTPDPLSPNGSISENSLHSNFDSPMSPSPLATPNHHLNPSSGTSSVAPPSVPAPATTAAAEPPIPRQLRSSSSEKRRISFGSDSQSSFDEGLSDGVQGWSRRAFPLTDAEVSEISLSTEQEPHKPLFNYRTRSLNSPMVVAPYESDDDSSASDKEVDDPNDPEWTVVSKRKQPKVESANDDGDPLVLHLAVKKEVVSNPS